MLRTRISRPPSRTTYGPALSRHILADQLDVDEAAFWACVQDGVRPARSTAPGPGHGLPVEFVHLLVHRVGFTEAEVRAMTRAQAVERLAAFWSELPSNE